MLKCSGYTIRHGSPSVSVVLSGVASPVRPQRNATRRKHDGRGISPATGVVMMIGPPCFLFAELGRSMVALGGGWVWLLVSCAMR